MLFIFDMGGVVSGNVATLPAMARLLGLTEGEFLQCSGVDPDESPETRYERGSIAHIQTGCIGPKEFWDSFLSKAAELPGGRGLPERAERMVRMAEIISFRDPWERVFSPVTKGDTVEALKRLREAGHRVVCGTNTMAAHFAVHEKQGDYRPFERVYASHLMGVIKPDPLFWTRILQAEGAEARETAFIDDNPVNVAAASALGIRAFLYENGETLQRDLFPWLGEGR